MSVNLGISGSWQRRVGTCIQITTAPLRTVGDWPATRLGLLL
ncbi:unnamed protein product [Ranitomeya imitator]|uniref:Uncharacterized protein n=1 Tax=Ranitomeya imitator TaxID=111125 RepID=A0ABN9L3G3_9NEOB|nr:unnamed protein product [Ranitomeya imitator]